MKQGEFSMITGYRTSVERCLATQRCSSCGLDFVADTLIGCVEAGVTPICGYCREAAEAVAGEDELTELLAEGELDLYFATIRDINLILDGEWTGTWN